VRSARNTDAHAGIGRDPDAHPQTLHRNVNDDVPPTLPLLPVLTGRRCSCGAWLRHDMRGGHTL
jgi:hypothetical protein